MEPVEATIRYIIYTSVAKIEERFQNVHVGGTGKDALFADISKGWFALFRGSWESLYLGRERPNLLVGDVVRITFERIE
jgi:hypothetical protein